MLVFLLVGGWNRRGILGRWCVLHLRFSCGVASSFGADPFLPVFFETVVIPGRLDSGGFQSTWPRPEICLDSHHVPVAEIGAAWITVFPRFKEKACLFPEESEIFLAGFRFVCHRKILPKYKTLLHRRSDKKAQQFRFGAERQTSPAQTKKRLHFSCPKMRYHRVVR